MSSRSTYGPSRAVPEAPIRTKSTFHSAKLLADLQYRDGVLNAIGIIKEACIETRFIPMQHEQTIHRKIDESVYGLGGLSILVGGLMAMANFSCEDGVDGTANCETQEDVDGVRRMASTGNTMLVGGLVLVGSVFLTNIVLGNTPETRTVDAPPEIRKSRPAICDELPAAGARLTLKDHVGKKLVDVTLDSRGRAEIPVSAFGGIEGLVKHRKIDYQLRNIDDRNGKLRAFGGLDLENIPDVARAALGVKIRALPKTQKRVRSELKSLRKIRKKLERFNRQCVGPRSKSARCRKALMAAVQALGRSKNFESGTLPGGIPVEVMMPQLRFMEAATRMAELRDAFPKLMERLPQISDADRLNGRRRQLKKLNGALKSLERTILAEGKKYNKVSHFSQTLLLTGIVLQNRRERGLGPNGEILPNRGQYLRRCKTECESKQAACKSRVIGYRGNMATCYSNYSICLRQCGY